MGLEIGGKLDAGARFQPVRIAVLTISDTRDEESDTSGQILIDRLRDSDVMSMSQSLELRVPFVDRPLIEWLWHQPSRFKENQPHPKAILAEATRDLLPPGLLSRRKRGFTLPFAVWMRGPLRPFLEETFSNDSVGYTGLFSTAEVQRFWDAFLKGNDSRGWSRVWSLAVLIAFTKTRKLRS